MKTYLWQAPELTAKSFFHSRSDLSVVQYVNIFKYRRNVQQAFKNEKKIDYHLFGWEAKKHYIFALRSNQHGSFWELISRLFLTNVSNCFYTDKENYLKHVKSLN